MCKQRPRGSARQGPRHRPGWSGAPRWQTSPHHTGKHDTGHLTVGSSADQFVHCSSISVQTQDTATEVSPESDEFVLVLVTQCGQKLQLLHAELEGQDLAAVMKEMEEEEVS